MIEITTHSVQETVKAGEILGKLLKKGDVVCLNGDLGAGKTAFTNGIAHALGIKGYITSPTFTIINEYSGQLPLYHFDVYRISDFTEMFEIGFEEYLDGGGVSVIEWAELIDPVLPSDRVSVTLTRGADDSRDIKICFIGERYKDRENRYDLEELH